MIRYEKNGITPNVLRLLGKYSDIEKRSIVADLENKFITAIEVFNESKLVGIIIIRGEYNLFQELGIVVLHVVAEDNLGPYTFSDILFDSMHEWLKSAKDKNGRNVFFWVRQESDRPGLSRMLRRVYGSPKIEVFEMRLNDAKSQKLINIIPGDNLDND